MRKEELSNMERTFKMAWGKGTLYGSIIGVFMEIVLIFVFFKVGLIYFGFGLLALCGLLMWFQYAAFQKNRYEINGNDLIVKCLGDKKRMYPIEKIHKIEFVDYGTEWLRGAPTSRYQLLLYFDRKFIKSVEPIRFGPEDREVFVDSLLVINPNITVVEGEIKI